jgi:hypothetical protein
MLRDLEWIDGEVAVGVLTEASQIDVRRLRRFPTPRVVFHRAFDLVPDPLTALEQLVDLGVPRVMASAADADLLRRLVDAARGRIGIMPAGGIRPENVRRLVERTGCDQVHGSFRRPATARCRSAGTPRRAATPSARFGIFSTKWTEERHGEQDFGQAEQQDVGRVRSPVEDVDGGAGDRLPADGSRERGSVRDLAATGVDQNRRRRHQRQEACRRGARCPVTCPRAALRSPDRGRASACRRPSPGTSNAAERRAGLYGSRPGLRRRRRPWQRLRQPKPGLARRLPALCSARSAVSTAMAGRARVGEGCFGGYSTPTRRKPPSRLPGS